MFGSSVLEVAIGMVFIYLLMSLICSALNEIIESLLKNRATDLESGIRDIFNQMGGGNLVSQFYNHPLINGLFHGLYQRAADTPITRLDYLSSSNLPSYIPARNFSLALIDVVLHPPATQEELIRPDDQARGGAVANPLNTPVNVTVLPATMESIRAGIGRNIGDTEVGRALRALAEQSGNNAEVFRENIEAWFNSTMDRVSGKYKRRTKWIIFWMGLALTVLLNVNSITIAGRLASDATLRSAIVAQAEGFSPGSGQEAREAFKENRAILEGLGLPIGWQGGFKPFPSPFDPWNHLLLPLLGWLMTAAAISLGAPFWFDLLNKFMVIRSTVKPHEKSLEEGSEDRQPPKSGTNAVTIRTNGGGEPPNPGTPEIGGLIPAAAELESTAMLEPDYSSSPRPPDEESEIDGCDVTIDVETPDEELPPTEGGIA